MKPYIILFLGCLILSCEKESNFDLPDVSANEPEIEGTIVDVQAVKNNADLVNNIPYTFEGTNTYMEAYVVSSDEAGNFYHELVVQDKAENPTAGLKISINKTALFQSYEVGRKIYVKLDGLSIGQSNGVVVIGDENNGAISEIPFPIIENHIIRSTEIKEIVPLEINIDDFSEAYENLFVKLENMQFIHNIVLPDPVTFAGELTDEYDGERKLMSCETGLTTFVSTSTFADFKSVDIPAGKGSVQGVLARNFYDDFYVLNINVPNDINFSNSERCDPEFLNCGNLYSGGPEVIFNEDFQDISNTDDVEEELGWENINVSGGNEVFNYKNSYGNKFLRISAYETGESPLIAWLVSPEINLDASVNEELSFNVLSSYDNGIILSAYITQDYSGNPLTTEWIPLDANIPMGPAGAATDAFHNSEIDISCLSGSFRVAFKYYGSDPDRSTTYDIDNIRVTGQ